MSDHAHKTIADMQAKVAEAEEGLANQKRLVNMLCEQYGMPIVYPDVGGQSNSVATLRPDQYYGQPLATCVRAYLEMRNARNQGAATVAEIYQALVHGGFRFETKNDDNAKRILRISLAKNTAAFHKLPNGTYGLLEWYPNVKTPKQAKPADDEPGDTDQETGDESPEKEDEND